MYFFVSYLPPPQTLEELLFFAINMCYALIHCVEYTCDSYMISIIIIIIVIFIVVVVVVVVVVALFFFAFNSIHNLFVRKICL